MKTTVNGSVSDIFFNLDWEMCSERDEETGVVSLSREKMLEEASWFSRAISDITSGGFEYTPEELVDDFFERL